MNDAMSTSTDAPALTDEQLMAVPHLGRVELIRGRIIMSPAGFEHGYIALLLGAKLLAHVDQHRLGIVSDSSSGFRLDEKNVLSPDVAFVAAERLKGLARLPRKFFSGAPDVAIEVLSPNDPAEEVRQKTADYFAHGTRLVWIVDPESRTVTLHRTPEDWRTLGVDDTLIGDPVVPGFALPLKELFAPPNFD